MRHLDRSPDDLTAWVHWNNSVVSIGREAAGIRILDARSR